MELREYLAVIWKYRLTIFIFFACAVIASGVASELVTPVYQASTTILIKDGTSLENPFLEALQVDKSAVADFVEILKSRSLLLPVAKEQGLASNQDTPEYTALRRSVIVQPVIGTNVIKITVESTKPSEARDVANGLVEEFISQNQMDNSIDARGARKFIGEQIRIVGQELSRAEEALKRYKEEKRVFAPEEEVKTALVQIAKLETMKAETDVSLNETRIRLTQIRRQLAAEKELIISATTISANPSIQSLRARLADLEIELSGAREKYTDTHPAVVALLAQVEEVKARMKREVDRVVSSQTETLNPVHQDLAVQAGRLAVEQLAFEVRGKTLGDLVSREEEKFATLPEKELKLANLMRNAKVSEQIYVMLKGKYEEVRITEAMKSANVRVIDEAITPTVPVRPRKLLNIGIAASLGLFVGVGLMFLIEYFDTTIRGPEEVEAALGLPVLGQIPSYLPGHLPPTGQEIAAMRDDE